MNNDIDLSDMLGPNNDRHSMPPRDDRSPDDNAEDSATPLRCDNSSANQDFLRGQRDKLLKLIESKPQDLERIQELYRDHLAGQFHIVDKGEWDRFWSLIDGLHSLGSSFQAGSILLGGWKAKLPDLQPPASLSDHVTSCANLQGDFITHFQKLGAYGKAVHLYRQYIRACDTNRTECPHWTELFSSWVTEHHTTFRPPVLNDKMELVVPPSPMTRKEIGQLISTGHFSDFQDSAEGWIHGHAPKAIHFLSVGNPAQGWKDFHWFCHAFNFLEPIRKNALCFYFLIQLPVE
jgi:hypothetical protein